MQQTRRAAYASAAHEAGLHATEQDPQLHVLAPITVIMQIETPARPRGRQCAGITPSTINTLCRVGLGYR